MAYSYPAYDSWSIVPVPATPGYKQISFTANDAVAQTQSPFTMQSQVQVWPGADYWTLDISMPAMAKAAAQPWISFLYALRGKANVFQFGDPLLKTPQGTPTGTPVVNGTHIAGATLLNTRGWTANSVNNLLPGDYLQVGYRMYSVLTVPVNADGSGDAQIEVWPSLRDALTDGNAITTSNCQALFRLSKNNRTWSINESKLYAISFSAIEAR